MAQEIILVVDADEKSQKLLEVSFKKEGYAVLLTETIKDAIKTIGAKSPDLIICDTNLPDGDGFTLCEQLKRNPNFASIPFLFLSEDEELSRKMKAFELGAAEYLTKPIFIKDVTSRVRLQLQELNKSRLHDADDDQTVTGSLDEITVIDLLQTIESRDRSGILQLEREQGIHAEVSFHKGNILDASCGPLRGEEALYRLMLWPKGTFSLEYKQVESADHIEKDSSALLIEGMRRFETWNDMIGTLPHLSRVFQAIPEATEQGLPQEVQQLIETFDGTNSLRRVVDQSHVDDLTTLRIIRKLLDEGLLEDVTPDASSLRQSAQHTNLASWLSERAAVKESAATPRTRRKPNLFDTTPGFKSVPGLNADSIVESDEEIKALANTLDEISSNSQEERQSIVEGQPPADASEEDITHWRFHWDKEANQPVATPKEKSADPFALNDLEHDLQRIEQMRRDEEARRIAAEQAFAAQQYSQATSNKPADTSPATPQTSGEEAPKEITQELHRESVLAELERRKQGTQDPRDGIEDMLERVKPSFADQVEQDFADGEDEHVSRQRTDQFIPVGNSSVGDATEVSQDDIETADLDREPSPKALVQLGAPEDDGEPTVSEEAAEAYKAGVSLEEQTLPQFDSVPTAPSSEGVEEEPPAPVEDDKGIEEDEVQEDEAQEEEPVSPDVADTEEVERQDEPEEEEEAHPSQAEDFIAHRNPRNQELVHAEVELKKGSVEEPVEDDQEEHEEDEHIAAALLDTSDELPEEDAPEEDAPEEPEEDELLEEEPPEAIAPPEEAPVEEDEEDGAYLFDAPAFDEEEGFNKAGLVGVLIVIAALIALIFFALGDNKKKKPKEDPVAIAAVIDAGPDLETLPDQGPDLKAIAAVDLGKDLGKDLGMGIATITPENAPDMSALFATHVHAQTARTILSASGKDPSQFEDPIAALAQETPDMSPDMKPDMAATDTPPTKETTEPTPEDVVKPPKDVKPTEPKSSEKTIDQRLKEVSSLVRRERYKKALKPARQLVKDAPDSGKAAGLLGSAELNGANNAKASIKSFERAQRLGYGSSSMYLDMATAYFMTQNRGKAKSTYEKFLKKYPKHKMAKEVESILNNQF